MRCKSGRRTNPEVLNWTALHRCYQSTGYYRRRFLYSGFSKVPGPWRAIGKDVRVKVDIGCQQDAADANKAIEARAPLRLHRLTSNHTVHRSLP